MTLAHRTGITLLFSTMTVLPSDGRAQERETVLDRIVHIEEGIRDVPATPRLEAGLDLLVRRVVVGDAELHVEEEGAGIPLVLINGGPGGTHHYFHPWFGRAAAYARVIYYDQRGTGLSDFEPGADGYSVEQAVADLDAVRGALGIDKWVMLGYSYGGFLAQYYTTIHPDRVAGLVLVGASAGMWADLGESRQWDYISDAEVAAMREARTRLRAARTERGWSSEEYLQRLLYHNWLNGDWKRQHFYKPTPEQFAQIALYEWVNDDNFNSVMNRSARKVDLSGAFDDNPIPSLLLEGKWDLTWGDAKPTILSRNHPQARMVVIEQAGHAIFSENTDAFFEELEAFVRGITPVRPAELEAYRRHLDTWRTAWQSSPRYALRAAGAGRSGSQQIAAAYAREWLDAGFGGTELLRIGFALYDSDRYEEALVAFSRMEEAAVATSGGARSQAVALIWQGHMLDLLGRREEALERYRRVVELDVSDGIRHDQYGMAYRFSQYAAERLLAPFEQIENTYP